VILGVRTEPHLVAPADPCWSQQMGLLYPTTVAKVEDRPAFGPQVSNIVATV
jgi:hypothetical protein